MTGDRIETAGDGRDYSNVIGRASSETPEPGSLDHLAYPDGPSRVRPAPATDLRADIEAWAAPQWRHTEGADYSRGRNDAIDQIRAILAAHPTVEALDDARRLRERVARAGSRLMGADDGVPLSARSTVESADVAQAWDEGFEAGHTWSPQTNGLPHDPPTNPYRQEASDDAR